MLAVGTAILQAVDLGLIAVGVLLGLVCVVVLLRSGRWRDPLAGIPITVSGPSVLGVAAVLYVYVLLHMAAGGVLVHADEAERVGEPGTEAWHRSQVAGSLAGVATSVVMVILLAKSGSLRLRRDAAGVGIGLSAALLGVLVLVPFMTAQFEAGKVLWEWAYPGEPAPTHVVLQAVRSSAWGPWGLVQLLTGAVVVAPLAEELFFRGVLLQACWQHTRRAWVSIVFAGVIFGIVHISQPQDVLPLVSMGILLGYVRFRCGVIWPCVLLHALFNARTMVMVVAAPELSEGLQ